MKFLKTFLASILSIVLFFILFGATFLFLIEKNVTKDKISMAIEDTDVIKLVEEVNINNEDDENIMDIIYTKAEEFGVSSDIVNELLNSKTMKETVGIIAGSVTESMLTGEVKELITVDEWNQIVKGAVDEIADDVHIDISQDQKDELASLVQVETKDFIEKVPTTKLISSIKPKFSINPFAKIQFLFSTKAKALIAGSILFLDILLFLLKRKEKGWLLYIATPLIILSIILFLIGFSLPIMARIVDLEGAIAMDIMRNVRSSTLISAAIGFILAIIGFVVYGIKPKKEEKLDAESLSVEDKN